MKMSPIGFDSCDFQCSVNVPYEVQLTSGCDHLSLVTSFSKYQVTTLYLQHPDCKQPQPLSEQKESFILVLTYSKQPLSRLWSIKKGVVTISHSSVLQETEIYQWEVLDFFLEFTFHTHNTFITWAKTLQLPSGNEEK